MTRRSTCGPAEARERLAYATEQLTFAALGEPWVTAAARKASGGCAVLAAIAAADAVCCKRLGHRSRDQDHRAAERLLREVEPEGGSLAKDLVIALGEKDAMQYGTDLVNAQRHLRLLRAANRLVESAATIIG